MQTQSPSFVVRTYSTGISSRAINEVRGHHFVVDDTVAHGGPGEEPSPSEYFLSGVSSCAVLMLEREARSRSIPLEQVEVTIEADRKPYGTPPSEHATFQRVALAFALVGPSEEQAHTLVDFYQHNCPLYGSVVIATPEVSVDVRTRTLTAARP
jgi:uncharacterized OsmC-like protein